MSLPHNTELERVLVSGLFSELPEIRHEILTQAKPEFIFDRNLRSIFTISAETGDDPVIAYDKAWEKNIRLKEELPKEEFDLIVRMDPKPDVFGDVIARLRRLWSRRELMRVAEGIVSTKGKAKINDIAQSINNLALFGEVSHYNDDPLECFDTIMDVAINGQGAETKDGFGIESLDEALRGLRRNDFVVIGAPSNVGKTPFVLDALRKRSEKGNGHQLVFTLEMTKEDVSRELVSMHSRIPLDFLLNGLPDDGGRDEAQAKVMGSLEWVAKNFSIIDPTVGELTETLVRAIINRKVAELLMQGKNVDCIMVDYLQLLSGDDNESITAWTRMFKIMAIQLQIPIILISSLNNSYLRRVDQAGPEDKYVIPNPADLRGSGNIMFDASKVLFLMNALDNNQQQGGKRRGNRYMYVLKNKYGLPHQLTKLNINRCLSYSDGHKED